MLPGRARINMVAEFKEWRIDAGEMDKVIGAAIRARGRGRPAVMEDVFVYCRGFTPEAMARGGRDRGCREYPDQVSGGAMTIAIDTSLTVHEPGSAVDVAVMADRDRHFVIHNRDVGWALQQVVAAEAPRTTVRVGGGVAGTEVSFYVLDLKRDKGLGREIGRLLHDAFVDAAVGALKTGAEKDFLDGLATSKLDAVEEIIELRRFIANATGLRSARRRRELLFHHALEHAAE